MKFTSIFVLAALAVSSLCADVNNIKADASQLGATVTGFHDVVDELSPTVGAGSPIQVERIIAASEKLVVAVSVFTGDAAIVSPPITDADGQDILNALDVIGPQYVVALQALVDRKEAIAALPTPVGLPGQTVDSPLVAVRKELGVVIVAAGKFKAALAVATPSSLRDAWNELADKVIATLQSTADAFA
ncbi:hypothetical protein C0991_011597 [Blastosporella zonata]|nr:hypothetical protein C0991_011597 [Blastosporella zonata]